MCQQRQAAMDQQMSSGQEEYNAICNNNKALIHQSQELVGTVTDLLTDKQKIAEDNRAMQEQIDFLNEHIQNIQCVRASYKKKQEELAS